MHSRCTSVSEPRQSATWRRSSRRITASATRSTGGSTLAAPYPGSPSLAGRPLPPPAPPPPVRQRQQPRERRTRRGVITVGGAPYLQVDVLRGFLAVARVAQHPG